MKPADNIPLVRTFVAITLPDPVKIFLKGLQKELKASGLKASWPSPEILHLTLAFIGDTAPGRLSSLGEAVQEAALAVSPFQFNAGGIGVFPSVKKARVIWSGVQTPTNTLARLHRVLTQGLSERSFPVDIRRRFTPHLTLARIKGNADPGQMARLMQQFQTQRSESVDARALTLFRSELKPSGAVHTVLMSADFSGPGSG